MRILLLLGLLALLPGAAEALEPKRPSSKQPTSAEQWVKTTLRKMTLDEKIGQMIFDRGPGRSTNYRGESFRRMRERVRKLRLGGYIIFGGTPHETAALLNELQRGAKIPLLIAGDLERGAASQFPGMAVSLPSNMGLGATGDPSTAAFAGMVTAREGRAIGFHWTYAPVADVNNNPENPIINIRSFGEDVNLVSRMVEAYVKACEQGGMLTTAKHFPGHGDTGTDSHIDLGVVTGDRARLDREELAPFRAAIRAGASSVMTAHLAVPSVEPDAELPATLSRNVLTGLLREQLGFQGMIVTDALVMGGITKHFWPGEVAVRAVEAGADALLIPPDPELAFRSLRRAVLKGRISKARLNESVERILRAKARLGLHRNRFVDLSQLGALVGDPALQAQADEIANRSITLVRDQRHILPLRVTGRKKLLLVVMNADPGSAGDNFVSEVRERVDDAEVVRAGPELTAAEAGEILKRADEADELVAPIYVRISAWKGTADLPASHAALLRRLAALHKPLVAISFSNPYLLRSIPEVPAYMCAYSIADVSERAAVRALFGEIPIQGKLPITIPAQTEPAQASRRAGTPRAGSVGGQAGPEAGAPTRELLAALGTGLQLPAWPMTLAYATEGPPSQDQRFHKAFDVLDQAVRNRAFPGAVLAVGYRGELVALKAFGRYEYSPDSPAVSTSTIWDLASVSKVVGTTTAAAMLVEQDKLLLDLPVVRYLPEFASQNVSASAPNPSGIPNASEPKARLALDAARGSKAPAGGGLEGAARDRVTVRQLLTHSSGMVSHEKLFLNHKDKESLLEAIYALPLANPPGAKYVYSDFGVILLGEIIESITGQPLDQYVREHLFEPLGMKNTMYNPPKELLPRIPPTEQDNIFRKRLVRGEVHDENAWAMGGVAGHAGMFSTAEDLAVFAQMMLQGGVYAHHRILQRSTVEMFTRRQGVVPGSSRALGWDTPSEGSSSGHYFSPHSYGHTGFTGTSLWMDPDKELFVILLTNRVYPTRENEAIAKVRPAVHDAVVEALGLNPAQWPEGW